MRNLTFSIAIGILFSVIACNPGKNDNKERDALRQEVQSYLDVYTATFQDLSYSSSKAEWAANTKIIEGDSTNAMAVEVSNKAYSDFVGSQENIEKIREYLGKKDQLDSLQSRQLERMLYRAADNPASQPELVRKRIKAEAAQNEALFGYDFQMDGKSVTTNQIDGILKEENDPAKRLKAWEASKEVGKNLKDGLVDLRDLRNETVKSLGYSDFFDYQVSSYDMTTEEMRTVLQSVIRDIWPLYRELHTFARYELAKKYGQPVPEMLPAHWLPNRWGQDWSSLIEVEGLDLDGALKDRTAEWIVEQGEDFYVSLGFDPLPKTFYELSDLYPLPEGTPWKKNNHASAWHLDLDKDVRSLMSVEPNAEWYETVHHELGHIYYYMLYSTPEVPIQLRGGANRGFHEAIGSMLGLAAMQKPFLEGRGVIPDGTETDMEKILLKEAMNYIVFLPWSAGVMTEFESELYNGLPADQFNQKWWDLKGKYQGIVSPSERGEEFCDAASKTHINNDAAQYYDYALSYVLLFQFHNHIAKNILNQPPSATNYYGNKEIGDFLRTVLSPGATKEWRGLMQETLGEGMNAQAMLSYFEPLMPYIKKLNEGRVHTLPEAI
jgi:peptidyl-dipeptidase A